MELVPAEAQGQELCLSSGLWQEPWHELSPAASQGVVAGSWLRHRGPGLWGGVMMSQLVAHPLCPAPAPMAEPIRALQALSQTPWVKCSPIASWDCAHTGSMG